MRQTRVVYSRRKELAARTMFCVWFHFMCRSYIRARDCRWTRFTFIICGIMSYFMNAFVRVERKGYFHGKKCFLEKVQMLKHLERVIYSKGTSNDSFSKNELSMYGMCACPVLFRTDLASGRTVLEDDYTNVITEYWPLIPIIYFIQCCLRCR